MPKLTYMELLTAFAGPRHDHPGRKSGRPYVDKPFIGFSSGTIRNKFARPRKRIALKLLAKQLGTSVITSEVRRIYNRIRNEQRKARITERRQCAVSN